MKAQIRVCESHEASINTQLYTLMNLFVENK